MPRQLPYKSGGTKGFFKIWVVILIKLVDTLFFVAEYVDACILYIIQMIDVYV